MSEKRRALGRGLGALIPSSPGTARPVDVFFRESSPPPSPDGAEPDPDPEEHPNGYGHDSSRDHALGEPPVHHEPPVDGTEGDQARTDGNQTGTDGREAKTHGGEERTDAGDVNGRGVTEQQRRAENHGGGGHPDARSDDRLNESGDGLRESNGASPVREAAATTGDGQDHPAGAPHLGRDPTANAAARDAAVTDSPDAGLAPVPGATFAILPIAVIRPNPRQPRTSFDEEELEELAASIREIGVLQPVVVRPIARAEREGPEHHAAELQDGPHPSGDVQPDRDMQAGGGRDEGSADVSPRFELIMGERRLRASQLAGLDTIPAIVKETHDDDLLRDALLENLHRTQLNPLEEAAAYQQLLDDFGCSHDELASRIGRSRPQISNTIRLLRLPPLVARRLAAGVLSAGHARALLGLDDAAAMERLAQRTVAEGLSVRSVEEIVALGGDDPTAIAKARRPRAGNRHPQLDDLAARLSDRYDTRVTIALGQRKGRLTVEFASVEDLNRIVGLMERI
jgi:ParB family chromosome partitioning protein